MKIIAVVNQKGGGGKTQATVHLAWEAKQRFSVAILDLDPTHQAVNWIEAADMGIDAVAIDLKSTDLEKYVKTIETEGEYGLVFIDTPANDMNAAMEAMMVADAVVIPVGVGTSDIGMLASTERQLRRVRQVRSADGHPLGLVRVLINRSGFAPKRTQRTTEAVETFGLETFEQQIPLLGAYQDATGNRISAAQHHYAPVLKEILDAFTQS